MPQKPRRYFTLRLVVFCLLLLGSTLRGAPQSDKDKKWGYYPANYGDVAQFLEYSTWGPNWNFMFYLAGLGYEQFLEDQFVAPLSSYPTLPLVPATIPADCDTICRRDNYSMYPLQNRFYLNALYGQDQLRQRVAFALHQIFVVSGVDITHPSRMAPYLQILDRNAFGNYRQLLYEITLNPAMGNYLDMAGNNADNPNENYAREVLQLFSIGLNQLNENGTPVLDQYGQPVPAYDQNTVNAFARVFTGWNFAAAPATGIVNYIDPMVPTQRRHDVSSKILLQGVTLPANQSAAQDLSAAIDNIFMHPNVGPFIGKQLIQHLVTSNPSPVYVQRVARAFADNGLGVRGDMKAVIKAILLDDEAAQNPTPDPGEGHLRHPVLFVTSLLRAFNPRSPDGINISDGYLNPQNVNMGLDLFRPPSVFSYFFPSTGVPRSSMMRPEFEILHTSRSVPRANFVNTMVFSRVGVAANSPYGTSMDLGQFDAFAGNPEELVAILNPIMMRGRMTKEMFDAIVVAVKAVAASNPHRRVQTAVYLIATSAQYQVVR